MTPTAERLTARAIEELDRAVENLTAACADVSVPKQRRAFLSQARECANQSRVLAQYVLTAEQKDAPARVAP